MKRSPFRGHVLAGMTAMMFATSCESEEKMIILEDLSVTATKALEMREGDGRFIRLEDVAAFEWDVVQGIGGGVPDQVRRKTLGTDFEIAASISETLAQNGTLLVFFLDEAIVGQAVVPGIPYVSVNSQIDRFERDDAALVQPSVAAGGMILDRR